MTNSRSGVAGGAWGDCGEEDSQEDHPQSGAEGGLFSGRFSHRRQDPQADQTDADLVFAVRQGTTDST